MLMPIPDLDFDPTEVAVSWKVLSGLGHEVLFATPTAAPDRADDFLEVVPGTPDAGLKTSGRARDSIDDSRPAFVVEDGNYISARWPGDSHTLAERLAAIL
ncbi:MAG TPA: hypothetical protein VMV06_07755 [Acidimicrobiales bacterium]|nr:hypothetical protein [Acidimicrobiales bacterium]